MFTGEEFDIPENFTDVAMELNITFSCPIVLNRIQLGCIDFNEMVSLAELHEILPCALSHVQCVPICTCVYNGK